MIALLLTAAQPAIPAATASAVDDVPALIGGVEIFTKKERQRAVGSAHKLSEKDLQQGDSEDLHKLVAEVPGVYVREEEGYGLRPNIGLRGASSNRSAKVTLMEDGILMAPAPYSAPEAYAFPITGRMVGLEVYKGPAAVRFGPQTIGGAINLLSRPIPEKSPLLLGRIAYGANNYHKAHVVGGGTVGKFGGLVEAISIGTDGHHELDGGGATGFAKREGIAKLLWRSQAKPSATHHIGLKLGLGAEDSRASYLGLTPEDFAANPHRRYGVTAGDRMVWDRNQAVLDHHLRLPHLRLRTALYRSELSRAWKKVGGFRNGPSLSALMKPDLSEDDALWLAVLRGEADSDNSDMAILVDTKARDYLSEGLESRGEAKLGKHRLHFGLRAHHDSVTSLNSSVGLLSQSGAFVDDGEAEKVGSEKVTWTRAYAAHLMDAWRPNKALTLTLGSRVEWIENGVAGKDKDAQQMAVLPGLGAHYQLDEAFGLLAGVHRGFSPVAPGQDDDIDPESSVNAELGARYKQAKHEFELIGFYNGYSNMLGQCTQSQGCPDDLIDAQFNGGAVDVWGLETEGKIKGKMGPVRWALKGNYTLSQSAFRTSFDSADKLFGSVTAGDEVPYMPVHQGKASATLGYNKIDLSIDGKGFGAMRDKAGSGDIPEAEAIPAHAQLDASLSWKLARTTSVKFSGRNLTDDNTMVSRRPYGARAGRPRQWLVGLEWREGKR